jgi:hypothetical protein
MQMVSNSSRRVADPERARGEVKKTDFPTFRNPAGRTSDDDAVTANIFGPGRHTVRGRAMAPAGIAGAVAVLGAVSLLIVDHGPWNRPYVESPRAHAATEAAAQADGALITPTRKPSLYSRIVRRLR